MGRGASFGVMAGFISSATSVAPANWSIKREDFSIREMIDSFFGRVMLCVSEYLRSH